MPDFSLTSKSNRTRTAPSRGVRYAVPIPGGSLSARCRAERYAKRHELYRLWVRSAGGLCVLPEMRDEARPHVSRVRSADRAGLRLLCALRRAARRSHGCDPRAATRRRLHRSPPNSAPDPEYADRRPATVLFADLTGFTTLSERLDPEDVRALQNELYEELRAALTQFGGFMEKFVGDAVMAVFGAPVAHEEDPERALRAALEMHSARRFAEHSVGAQARPSADAACGCEYRSRRRRQHRFDGGSVCGDGRHREHCCAAAIGSASPRKRWSAAPRICSRTMRSRSSQRGSVALKGKAEPIPVYRLIGVEERPRPARGLEAHGLRAPFVGRDDEMKQMLAAFDLALRGRSQVVSLIGEAGAGKSRLVEEFLERIHARPDAQTLTIRRAVCSSLGEQPYGIIATFIRQGYGVVPADPVEVARRKIEDGLRELGVGAEEAAGVAPMVGYVLGLQSVERLPDIEPDRLNRQILMLVRMVLERRLDQGPLLLIVEDLHWADAASIQGLRLLVEWFADRPLILLFTYRPSFDSRALVVVRATHTALRLLPLSEADIDSDARRVVRRRRGHLYRHRSPPAHRAASRRQSVLPRGDPARADRR